MQFAVEFLCVACPAAESTALPIASPLLATLGTKLCIMAHAANGVRVQLVSVLWNSYANVLRGP